MLARVIVGPGKPKLVQIQRPPSSTTSNRSKHTMDRIQASLDAPSTPDCETQEVSLFSPYSTPCESNPATDSVTGPTRASRLLKNAPSTPAQNILEMSPGSLSTQSRHCSVRTTSTVFDAREMNTQSMDDPFWSPQDCDTGIQQRDRPHIPRSVTDPLMVQEASNLKLGSLYSHISSAEYCKIENITNSVTDAIESFPKRMLSLDSPVICEIRSRRPAGEHKILDPVAKIFPSAPQKLISALAGWLIAEQYFRKAVHSFDLESRPEPDRPQLRASKSAIFSWSAFPHVPTQKGSHRQAFRENIAAISNESLHRIPEKARDVLGIKTDLRQRNEAALKAKVNGVHAGIGVIGLKLLGTMPSASQAPNTEQRNNSDLWKALCVMVEVIEG